MWGPRPASRERGAVARSPSGPYLQLTAAMAWRGSVGFLDAFPHGNTVRGDVTRGSSGLRRVDPDRGRVESAAPPLDGQHGDHEERLHDTSPLP